MCGIIGNVGHEAAAPQLIDALKRLEYRGYDSAGAATLEHGVLPPRGARGELKNFAERRGEPAAKGAKFVTETYTQVVAPLGRQEMERRASPVEAVKAALPR